MLLPQLMSTREKWQVRLSEENTGSSTMAYPPGVGMMGGWSSWPQVTSFSDQFMNWGI
jgi:hypothetical protein